MRFRDRQNNFNRQSIMGLGNHDSSARKVSGCKRGHLSTRTFAFLLSTLSGRAVSHQAIPDMLGVLLLEVQCVPVSC